MRLRFLLALVLMSGSPAWGQFHFFEAERWSAIEAPPGKAVIADVTATTTSPTPWGPFSETETGKYWRSRSGKVRQDTSHGLSTVVELGSSPRWLAYIDYQLQRIWRNEEQVGRGSPKISRAEDVLGKDFKLGAAGGMTKPKKTGQAVVEGFKVTIRTGELLDFPPRKSHRADSDDPLNGYSTGLTYEIWTSDELKMILLFKLKAGTTEFVQRYHNIRREEPDPALFQLPSGFQTLTLSHDLNGACVTQKGSISGDRAPADVTRFCNRP